MAKITALTKASAGDSFKAVLKGESKHMWRVSHALKDSVPGPHTAAGVNVATATSGEILDEALLCLAEERYADAQALAGAVTTREPANADAWSILGQAYFLWKQPDEAISAYRAGIRHRPNSAEMYSDLGFIYGTMSRAAEARDCLERAVQIDPATPLHRARLALVLAELKRTQEAVALLEKCAAEEPDNGDFRNLLAAAYLENGMRDWWVDAKGGARYCTSKEQLDDARAFLEKAQQLGTDDEELRKRLIEQDKLLKRLAEREGEASWTAIILFGVFYILPGVAWAYVHKRPRYLINRDYMAASTGQPLRTSLKLWRLVGKGYGLIDKNDDVSWVTLAVMLPVQMVLLPVFFLLALKENYLDVG